METTFRFEVKDRKWIRSKVAEQSVPQSTSFPIQLLSFDESISKSDDLLLVSPDASKKTSQQKLFLATPSYSKKKKETSFEEIWSALKPRSPGFNYFPDRSEDTSESKNDPKSELSSKSEIPPKPELSSRTENKPKCELDSRTENEPKCILKSGTENEAKSELGSRSENTSKSEFSSQSEIALKSELSSQSETASKSELCSQLENSPKSKLISISENAAKCELVKSSSLFASAKGRAVELSDQAKSRARSLLLEEVDSLLPVKRKADSSFKIPSKKPATNFKVPFKGFKPPFRRSMINVETPALPVVPRTAQLKNSGEIRRATLTGPPDTQQNSWRPLGSNLRTSVADSFVQMTIPDSPLLSVLKLPFDSSSAILPSVSQRFVFANGMNSHRLWQQMMDRGFNVSLPWVTQHYRWIIWTLSGLPPDHRTPLFNPDTTLQELEYRYYAETRNLGVSCLQQLAKEGKSSSQLVLLVAGIQFSSVQSRSMRLELSDQWTSVFVEIDQALQSRITSKRIRIGSFLSVHRLQIIQKQTDQPLILQMKHNDCIVVPDGTQLGVHEDEKLFIPLSWVDVSGGNISRTRVCISRKYPLTFKHRSPDGRYLDLTVTQHQRKMNKFDEKMEDLRTRAKADVKEKQFAFFTAVLDRKKTGEQVDEMEWLFAMHLIEQDIDETLLTNEALLDLEQFRQVHEKTFAKCVEDTIDRLSRERGISKPLGRPHLDLLVSEVNTSEVRQVVTAQLTIWLDDLEEEEGRFKEGEVFEFTELSVGSYPAANGVMSLRSTKLTTQRCLGPHDGLTDGLNALYSSRSPVQDLSGLKNGDLFDFEAFVVKDSDGVCFICRSAEFPDAEELLMKISLLDNNDDDPLIKTKAGEVLLLQDLAFGSYSKSENLALVFITQRTSFNLIKKHKNQEKLIQYLH
eukprot:g985.t1